MLDFTGVPCLWAFFGILEALVGRVSNIILIHQELKCGSSLEKKHALSLQVPRGNFPSLPLFLY